jgi:hypothetical protein
MSMERREKKEVARESSSLERIGAKSEEANKT